ncbi:hypothetical protein ACLEAN_12355, partial [Escherichia coli]
GGTADRNRSHWSTSKTPSYTKSVSWHHHQNPLMTLKPNDTNSVYIDYETEDDTSDGVYPNQGNGTSQPLHFQATLKQDGNIAIEPGEFKATSTFQVTYP